MTSAPNPIGQAAESGIVSALLSRQDEVIAELDLLEAQILGVIEDLSAERKIDIGNEEANVIPMESQPTESAKKKPLIKAA